MPVIEVEHLHKQYGDQVAVDDLSFTVERGEIFGILGPNGAGPSCGGGSGPSSRRASCPRS